MVYRTNYWHTNAFDPKMLMAISYVFTSITIGSLFFWVFVEVLSCSVSIVEEPSGEVFIC